ncbi:MAG TPA: hypothetical protein VFF67_02780 [Thermoplasmata archaeon]|nr:hypothetical protein [Thermoplasmata archaeon]
MPRPFAPALRDHPLFFEPLPPSARATPARRAEQLEAVVRLLRAEPAVDAVDVPELVDENHEGRPFYRSADPTQFARSIAQETGCTAIVNRVVAHVPSAEAVAEWVRGTIGQGVRHVVLVGGSSRYIPYPGPGVIEANRISRPVLEAVGGALGNIAIPQREGEAHRLLAKTRSGASFFTTQIVFDGAQVLKMIQEYDRLCSQSGVPPAAILLSVAPVADEGDAAFIRWLGADFPESAERAILNGDESGSTGRSIRHALNVWQEVRNRVVERGVRVPVGLNVEQVQLRHLESAGELLSAAARTLDRGRSATAGDAERSPAASAESGTTA